LLLAVVVTALGAVFAAGAEPATAATTSFDPQSGTVTITVTSADAAAGTSLVQLDPMITPAGEPDAAGGRLSVCPQCDAALAALNPAQVRRVEIDATAPYRLDFGHEDTLANGYGPIPVTLNSSSDQNQIYFHHYGPSGGFPIVIHGLGRDFEIQNPDGATHEDLTCATGSLSRVTVTATRNNDDVDLAASTVPVSDGYVVQMGQGNDDFYGSPDAVGPSTEAMGSGNDHIVTFGTADDVNLGGGLDEAYTGAGRDEVVDTRPGSATIDTGAGDDGVWDDSGRAIVDTGAGADSVDVTGSSDTVDTGPGNDRILAGSAGDNVDLDAGSGSDHVTLAPDGRTYEVDCGPGLDFTNVPLRAARRCERAERL
jgi:hypothetical protein